MIWIGIGIGIIFTSMFGMALLVIVSKQKSNQFNSKSLEDYWEKSLINQRVQITAIVQIANALEERNTSTIKGV